jgi:serine protease Do
MRNPRQFVTLALILGAVIFGMALAGGLELTPVAESGPAVPVAAVPVASPGATAPGAGLPDFVALATAVDPAVVSIQAATIDERPRGRRGADPFEFFFGPRQRPQEPQEEQAPFRSDSGGSGFIISGDGLIVTNYHVIRGADEVRVFVGERDREYVAEVKGTDPATDLALLQIRPERELTYVRLGDSDSLRVGEWVMAIGSPLNFTHTVTVGVVSGKGRALGISDVSFENFIQTDAAINFGNSGGPLLNLTGEVVGINTAINFGAENIGFAVPVNTLKQILPQLREAGRVRRGYLGIEIRNVDFEAAEAYGLPSTEGALVARVVEGEPADNAGVQSEDIVLRVDEVPVKTTRDLIDYVSAKGPGASVDLEVLRNGERKKLHVKLAERSAGDAEEEAAEPEQESGIDWLGLRYQDLSPGMRESHGVPAGVEGVWITSVAPTSPLYDEGVRSAGVIHVITSVNGQRVTGVAEFERIVKAARSGSRLRLYIRRFAQGEEQQPILAFPAVP